MDAIVKASRSSGRPGAEQSSSGGNSSKPPLIRWAVTYAPRFEIVTALEARSPENLGKLNGAKRTVVCPFEDEHTTVGGAGTFAVNASQLAQAGLPYIKSGFVLKCSHNACAERDRLNLLAGMIERGWLTDEDLIDPRFLIAPSERSERTSGTSGEGSKIGLDGLSDAIQRGFNPKIPDDGREAIRISSELAEDIGKCEKALIKSPLVEVYQRGGFVVTRGMDKGKSFDEEVVVYDDITHHDSDSFSIVLAKAMRFMSASAPRIMFNVIHPRATPPNCWRIRKRTTPSCAG
jgi:hypothetical protein